MNLLTPTQVDTVTHKELKNLLFEMFTTSTFVFVVKTFR